jgi:hypothetical protein
MTVVYRNQMRSMICFSLVLTDESPLEETLPPTPVLIDLSISYSLALGILSLAFSLENKIISIFSSSFFSSTFLAVNQESILLTSCRSLVHCPATYAGEKN